MKPKRSTQISRYGWNFDGWPDWRIELYCWTNGSRVPGRRVEHLQRLLATTQPEIAWNPWSEIRYESFTDDTFADKIGESTVRNIGWVGCGAGGKTHDAGVGLYFWWLSDPENTCVALTSTGHHKMRQRVWPLIQSCHAAMVPFLQDAGMNVPHLLNSTMELQATKGDSKHAIFGQAIEEGEIEKAVEKLKGVHAPRIGLVIDEAPGAETAIFSTIPNMLKGCQEFLLVVIGNGPMTHFNSFSRVCRPVNGWSSVNVEMERWQTGGVSEFQLPKGICLHFDGTKSPNVKAGKTLYPFLYTYEDFERTRRNPDIQRSAMYYSQDRGFWPPEGFLNTVLNEELIEQGGARGEVMFASATTPIGSVDPGFGGDECVLRFGKMGRLADGKLAVQIQERIRVPINVDQTDASGKRVPAEYQMFAFVREQAEKRRVKPEYFGVEASGTGRGAAAILTQEWGPVITVESGGKPSDLQASEEDERASHEVYDRRITELWFSVQAFVRGKQLGGLTEEDCQQFCARLYDLPNKKYKLETKEDLKPRLGQSPDAADSVAVLIEVARRHGMRTVGPRGERMQSAFQRVVADQQRVYQEENLYQEEEPA